MRKTVSNEYVRATENVAIVDGIDIEFTRENIEGGVELSIQECRHAVIVHLGGRMTALEMELDGCSLSAEPANVEEIWIVPAGRRYASRARGGDVQYGVISLREDVFESLAPGHSGRETLRPLHGKRDPFCFWAMRELMHLMPAAGDDVSAMLAESLLRTLCLHIARSYGCELAPSAVQPHCPFDEGAIRQLRAYIHDNLSERIVTADLLDIAGLPPERFFSSFRRVFGTTPGQYVIEQRLRRARWMLTHSKDSITDIACHTGFSSHAHLSRTTGQSPRQFRQRHA